METPNPSIESLLKAPSDFSSCLFRYLMSDQVKVNLVDVTAGDNDPIAFAAEIEKVAGKEICRKFFTNLSQVDKIPEILCRAWVYDVVLSVAAFSRLAHLFPDDKEKQQKMHGVSCIYALNINDKRNPISHFGGLTHFNTHYNAYMSNYRYEFDSGDVVLLDKVARSISAIDKPDWLLWKPSWQVLTERIDYLKAFRRFIHASFISFVMTDDNVMGCFDLSKEDIAVLMWDYLNVVNDPDATKKDVTEFLSRIHMYFHEGSMYPPCEMILHAPYQALYHFFHGYANHPMILAQNASGTPSLVN
jgi:hypothetical protein